jgi:imidazolonepropionase-like amidohydrolase
MKEIFRMRPSLRNASFLLVLFQLSLCAQLQAHDDSRLVVLRCGLLIDGVNNSAQPNVAVVVQDDSIKAVERSTSFPPTAEVIDLSHATCLPGLIDLHVHLLSNPGLGSSENQYFFRSSGRKTLDGLRNAQTMLRSGFTTLRIPGDDDLYYSDIDVRDAIARHEFSGPRLLVAPHMLTATGGHGDYNGLAADVLVRAGNPVVSGVNSAQEIVRQEIKYGADWIKIALTGGVMSLGDDPRVTSFTDEEVSAMVDEAHRYRKKVCVHAHGTEGIKQAIRAGVDSVEHASLIDQEGIRLMKEHGTYLVATLFVLNYIVEQGEKQGYPGTMIAKGKALLEARDRNLRAAFAAGVKTGFGSDTIFPHEMANQEFAHLVRLGLAPMQAIRAATSNAADLLGLSSEIGSVEAGKKADIVAVSVNPLSDIRSLERVRFVMRNGQIIKNEF